MKLFAFVESINMDLWLDIMLLIGCAVLYIIFLSNWFKKVQVAFNLSGPKSLPIIGNSLLIADSDELIKLGMTAYEKYGPIFRVWMSFLPMFVILEPRDLQSVLGSNKNTEKSFFYSLMHNFLGHGLITNSGSKWRTHRKLLQPSFNLNILETFLDTFSDSANSLIQKLKNASVDCEYVNITTFINNAVLDILNESILGIPVIQNPYENQLENSPFRQGKVTTQDRIAQPWLLFDCLYNLTKNGKSENNQRRNLITFSKQIIEIRKKERNKGIYKKEKTCLLERMLDIQEEHPEFTDNDIANEICTFMLGGQESVATSVAMCLYFLAKHKTIQSKVFEEQKAIFNEHCRMPNAKDLINMKYLEQCVKETLRLCPSVPLMAKKIGENIKVGKITLPAGSDILITPFATQRIAHIYSNPDVFDPDRFTAKNMERRHPFAFIPFSAGPRNCIGYKFAMLEIKTIVSTIIRNYDIDVKPGYELKLAFRIILRAKGGIWLAFRSRK